ncbi:hypothetical protein AB0F81_23110, partial [Actinoplanes sp. NPDC024001]|uniref:hypothetical protein n=1 Tax=Actinoplanes sp. NPDC024001 TaxID=3154598 RepID=UPI00340DDA58
GDRPAGPATGPPVGDLSLGQRADRASEPASRDEQRPRCSLAGPVVLRRSAPAVPACQAAHTAGDWLVAARFALGTPDACALVRVRVHDGAFRVTFCADEVRLEAETGRLVRTLAARPMPAAADPAAWRHLEVRAAGADLEVSLDRQTVLASPGVTTPQARGAVVLGMAPGDAVVTFADVAVEPL